MANPYGQAINTFSDFTPDQMEIQRRQKMADLLQQQALTMPEQQMAGGYVVPISWTQGLAKLAQGLSSGYLADRKSVV